jgi:alanyl aminopeptidase
MWPSIHPGKLRHQIKILRQIESHDEELGTNLVTGNCSTSFAPRTGNQRSHEQEALLTAMGNSSKPEIAAAALEELAKDDFDLRASLAILAEMIKVRETRETGFDFVPGTWINWRGLGSRWGSEILGKFCLLPADSSVQSRASQKSRHFEPRVGKFTGGPRALARAVETIQSCIAKREAQQASLAAFYRSY